MRRRLMTVAGLGVLTTMLMAAVASAGPVQRREGRQQARIAQGVRSGELTPRETNRLEREQRGVERRREHALADGQIGPRERAGLQRAQNRASRDIHRLKHNGREMSWAR